jgi:hypothetical protein
LVPRILPFFFFFGVLWFLFECVGFHHTHTQVDTLCCKGGEEKIRAQVSSL